jgi:hypothetical protein
MVTKEPVRLSYIHLLEPREAQAGQKPKYDAQLIIPKTCTKVIEQINQMVQYARDNAVQDGRAWAKTAKSPLRDGDGERPNGGNYGPECKGCMVMNASSTRKPGIVDRKLQQIIDPAEIYSGMWANVDLAFATYDMSGNKGIKVYLNNVQKVRDDEPLGGASERAENVFQAVADDDDDLGL